MLHLTLTGPLINIRSILVKYPLLYYCSNCYPMVAAAVLTYHKVASSRLSRSVAHFHIVRLFDAYVLRPQ